MLFLIFCYTIVFASVIGGFVMHGGNLHTLWQPFEGVIIMGGAIGAFILANGASGTRKIFREIRQALTEKKVDKQYNKQLLSCLYLFLVKTKKVGKVGVENDFENPHNSEVFSKSPLVLQDKESLSFIVDYLRMIGMSQNQSAEDVSMLMSVDIKTRRKEKMKSANAVQKCADGLPAFGIIAAVMGVIVVMGSVGEVSNAELGNLIAGALVGTFLGILLCYGFVGPLASILEAKANKEEKKYETVKTVLISDLSGASPNISVEFGRKCLDPEVRPEFEELESMLRDAKSIVQNITPKKAA